MNKYFLNDITAKIFFLVELQGKQQMDLLGIDYEYYSNKKLAKNWYENLKTDIENSEHPMKDVAIANLEKLYKGMK